MRGPLFRSTNCSKRPLKQQRFSCTVVNLAGFLYIELRVRRAFCTIWPRRAKQCHSVRQDVGAVASSLQLGMVRFVPLTKSGKRFIPLTKCQLSKLKLLNPLIYGRVRINVDKITPDSAVFSVDLKVLTFTHYTDQCLNVALHAAEPL